MQRKSERGVVLELLSDGRARIKVPRTSGCGSCSDHQGCSGDPLGSDSMVVVAQNRSGARKGQQVVVEYLSPSSNKAMAVLYLIPLVGLLLGAILGYRLELFGSRDASAVLLSLVFLAGSFYGISRYDRAHWAKDDRLQPVVVRVLPSGAAPRPGGGSAPCCR